MLKLERLLGLAVCAFAVALSFRITITYVVLVVGFVVWLLWKLLGRRAEKLNKSEKSKPLVALGPMTIPLVAYALAVTISGVGRSAPELGPSTAKEIFTNLSTLRPLIVYFWAFDVFSNCPQFRLPAILSMLVVSGAAGIVAFIQQRFSWHPWGPQFLQGTGFFSEPMAFSGVMQIFSLLALGILIADGYRRFRRPFNNTIAYGLIVLANIAGLIFAGERGAWAGFAVASLAATALLSWRVMLATGTGMSVLLAAGWFFVPVIKTRLLPVFTGQHDEGVASRVQVWHRAYAEFLKSPLTGIGTTKFPHIEIKGATEIGKSYLAHAHNNVLQVLSTAGILGLSSYILILASAFVTVVRHLLRNTRRGWQSSSKKRTERGIAIGLFAVLISLTVSGLSEYNFGTAQVRLALWFALALISSEI